MLGGGADGAPVGVLGDLKAVLVGVVLAVLGDHGGVLFVPDITDALEEEQRQDGRRIASPNNERTSRPSDASCQAFAFRHTTPRFQVG